MESENRKNITNRRIFFIKKNRSNSPFLLTRTNSKINIKKNSLPEKSLNLSISQKIILNNSSLINPNLKNTRYSSEIKTSNLNYNRLYDDIIKLKNKINKLKIELSLLKGESYKKEEEIKDVQKILDNSKKNIKEKKYLKKLNEKNQTIKLKESYQKMQQEIKERKEENKIISYKIKNINIEEFEIENNNELDLFKEKVNEYRNNLKISKEQEKELDECYSKKEMFMKNHNYLERIFKEIEEKNNKIYKMKEKLDKLREQYNKLNDNKQRILTFNDTVKKNNEKLMIDKKKREDFIIQKSLIIQKLKDLENKTKDLNIEEKKNEREVSEIINKKKEKELRPKIFKVNIEKKPEFNKKKLLFESLIRESKKRQKEYIELFEYYNDFLKQNKYSLRINKKEELKSYDSKSKNDAKNDSKKEDKDNYSAFINFSSNSTNRNNDINIVSNKDEKLEDEFENFKFLLSIMLYTKNVQREKIENIILNYRTQNYFLDNLIDKNNYLLKLSKEILDLIKDKNENDIDLLKNLFVHLLDEKYRGNKKLFLDNILNDFSEKNQNILIKMKKMIYLKK